jgi:serine/threonine protein kinase
MDRETSGLPLSSLREISLLQGLVRANEIECSFSNGMIRMWNLIVSCVVAPMSLLRLRHENIVQLKQVVVEPWDLASCYLVMEYCEQDLATLMDVSRHTFTEHEIKCMMNQLLNGLAFCHDNFVIHRLVLRSIWQNASITRFQEEMKDPHNVER